MSTRSHETPRVDSHETKRLYKFAESSAYCDQVESRGSNIKSRVWWHGRREELRSCLPITHRNQRIDNTHNNDVCPLRRPDSSPYLLHSSTPSVTNCRRLAQSAFLRTDIRGWAHPQPNPNIQREFCRASHDPIAICIKIWNQDACSAIRPPSVPITIPPLTYMTPQLLPANRTSCPVC
jgi:hypothetical protein